MWCRNECFTLFGKFRQEYRDTVLAPSDDNLTQLSSALALREVDEEVFVDAQEALEAERGASKKRKSSIEGLAKAMHGPSTDEQSPTAEHHQQHQRAPDPPARTVKLLASDPAVVTTRLARRLLHWGSDVIAAAQVGRPVVFSGIFDVQHR
jgi:hypothetical protein